MKGFHHIRACLPDRGIVAIDVGIENGRVSFLGNARESIDELAPANGILLPGFLDEHIHGAGGADAMDASADALATISASLAKEGTTAFLATTMTQSPDAIASALRAVASAAGSDQLSGAALLGAHLEGPFISPKHVGAQNPAHLQLPDPALFDEWQNIAGGKIRMLSLAPELSGAPDLIRHLRQAGVAVSAGHTDAGFDVMTQAVRAGLSSVTHTFNAQAGIHHREIGTAGSALLLDELYTELICDTIHVSVPAIRLLLRTKPHDRVILITDAMRAKGLPDGVSELGGQEVIVRTGDEGRTARLSDGTLAGSVLCMNEAIRNMVEKVGVPLPEAVDFATRNPAKHLGVFGERGSIEVGKRADFTVIDDHFNVLLTVVGGRVVYQK